MEPAQLLDFDLVAIQSSPVRGDIIERQVEFNVAVLFREVEIDRLHYRSVILW